MKGKFFFITLLLANLVGLNGLAAASALNGTMRVVDLQGQATATQLSNGATFQIAEGTIFTQGFRIDTSANSSLALVLSNGTVVGIDPNTSVSVVNFKHTPPATPNNRPLSEVTDEIGSAQVALYLHGGSVYVDSKKLSAGSSFQIEDENIISEIVGTLYTHFNIGPVSQIEVKVGQVNTKPNPQLSGSGFGPQDPGSHIYQKTNQQVNKLDPNAPNLPSTPQLANQQNQWGTRVQQIFGSHNPPPPVNGAPDTVSITGATPTTPTTPPAPPAPTTTPDQEDENNIRTANRRVFTNPVTQNQVFSGGNFVGNVDTDVISTIE